MPSFIVRIELHNAEQDQYQKLYECMRSEGFWTIITEKGITYKLPPAEYEITSDKPISEILLMARLAAATTNCSYEIIVSQLSSFAHYGLSKVPIRLREF